ncbi:MAG: DUF4845 domain-containing protein [Moraxella osloensis]
MSDGQRRIRHEPTKSSARRQRNGYRDYDCTYRRVCQNRFSYYPCPSRSLPTQKIVGIELKKSNDNKESVKEFLGNVNSQWHINGVSQKAEDVVEVVDNTPGAMSVKLKYDEANNFFGNVDIVNRFEDTISAEDAKVAKP